MRKILELDEKHFLTGIAPSAHIQDKGLWFAANGLSVFGDIFSGDESVGLMAAAPSPTDITGSTVVDKPFAWVTDVSGQSTKHLYIWGDAGNLYKIDISGDNLPSNVASGAAVSNPANGLQIFQPVGGTRYLYYWQSMQIGRWDPTAAWATRTSNWQTGLQSTTHHPTHRFLDRIFYGNLFYIGYIGDDGASGVEHVADALDVQRNERVNCLSDDGVYLVAGLSTNLSTDNLTRGSSRIIFWDTNSSSWAREWEIPDAAIHAIRKVGPVLEAVTSRGLFAFTFSTPPVQILPYLTSSDTPDYATPTHAAADVFGEAILWGGSGRISTFGKVLPGTPNAFFQPFTGFTGTVCLVAASAKTNDVFVGTTSSKLYRVKWGDTPTTNVSAETVYIDLKRWWQIGRIVVNFDNQLISGDSFSIALDPDNATSQSWGTVSYASHGAIRTKELYGSREARKLRLSFTFGGGAPRVRSIEVWGDPISVPTHARV